MQRRVVAILGFLAAVCAFAAAVGWFALAAALDPLASRGRSDLALASDRLMSQLQGYRELAVILSDHPALTARLGDDGGTRAAAEALLLRNADRTGSVEMTLLGADGRAAASSRGAAASPPDHSGLPHFDRAMTGALGAWHAQTGADGRRAFYFAAPVRTEGEARPAGALAVKVDIEAIENQWRGDPRAVYFTDVRGVVFVTNRTELHFRTRAETETLRAALPPGQYRANALSPFPAVTPWRIAGHELWRIDGGRYLPDTALHLEEPLPAIAMTAEILMDARPAFQLAAWQALVAGALCLAFGAVVFVALERRRTMAERLAIEAAAKAALEDRVAERTAELSQANAALRREVGERKEAEAALKKAQSDLVQAGKLSALGKMSAGISHELNQPLMAIRSFAENAAVFMERDRPDRARENLLRISELARRMGRIIKNLRAFARQESEPLGRVDLGAVVDAVLEISAARLAQSGTAVTWTPPARRVEVRGGEVRLQQVVLNLVSNAVDAMEGREDKRIAITIETAPRHVALVLRDTGPGLSEPEKIFDPFYSTKEVGESEGMGLGLSISYGIVQSFGGEIRGRNAAGGGAVFTVVLSPWNAEEQAA
jgi:two-component system C4-dicarboxylate transport sensor histidine kinase DctB